MNVAIFLAFTNVKQLKTNVTCCETLQDNRKGTSGNLAETVAYPQLIPTTKKDLLSNIYYEQFYIT